MSVITTPVPTPAPALPVRGEHFRQAVSPMLSRLAAERATGVLLRETGALYLSDGEVVHAESPRSPGLDVLLTTGGVLDTDGWREAVDTAGAGLRVGRFLVDSGRVARGALELCHAGALFDAAYFVLGPSSAPASFRYGAAHWLGPIRPVPLAAVEREARRRRDLLHRIWPDPATDDAPLIRAARLEAQPVPARQGAVLGQVDGFRTAAEISLTLGRPAFHTLVDIRRLAAAGLISTARPGPPKAPRTPPAPAGPDHSPATHQGPAPVTPPQPTTSPAAPDRVPPADPDGIAPADPDHVGPAATDRATSSGPGDTAAADPGHIASTDPDRLPPAYLTDLATGGRGHPSSAAPDHTSPAHPSRTAPAGFTGRPPAAPGHPLAAGPPSGGEAPPLTPPWPLTTTDPDVALLQRLRDALEAL